MTVEQLIAALEAADIGYGSNGYVSTELEGEICIDGTYNVEKLMHALRTALEGSLRGVEKLRETRDALMHATLGGPVDEDETDIIAALDAYTEAARNTVRS